MRKKSGQKKVRLPRYPNQSHWPQSPSLIVASTGLWLGKRGPSTALQAIESFQNHFAGAVAFPENLLRSALAFGHESSVRECREHVFGVLAGDGVEVEVGRVELGPDFGPLGLFPEMHAVAART